MQHLPNKSFFPILVQYADRSEPTVVATSKDFRSGVGTRLLKLNYEG